MSAMELSPAILSPERVLENAHALMSAAMIDAKRARMRAEGERQMLANRLSRLQAEELRATKRIEETHRRTMEILAAKNRHQQHAEQKEQLRLEQEQLIEQHRQELNRIREERKEAMRQATLATRQAMQEQVRAQKEISARAASEVAYMREVEQEMAIFKRNAVRQGEAQARERKMREKELMIAHLQQRAEERRREEELRTHLYDQNLAELERQEYELILSLQKQREEHHNVYRELEKEMGGRNDEGGLDDSNVFLTRIPS
ncbi:hypothetical protein AB1Y20_014218 [Prymnesium parvum]|uniref:Meiosis-specific nuclear structural protein 1 n=1 Tax=Prymnesium parvum TaxID=97485 RepID=A0AB34IG76_PRYPA